MGQQQFQIICVFSVGALFSRGCIQRFSCALCDRCDPAAAILRPFGLCKAGGSWRCYNLHMGRMVVVSLKTGLNDGKLGNPAYLMHSCIMKSRVSLALKPRLRQTKYGDQVNYEIAWIRWNSSNSEVDHILTIKITYYDHNTIGPSRGLQVSDLPPTPKG